MSKANEIKFKSYSSSEEIAQRGNLLDLLKNCPIPDNELLVNLGLFLKRQDLSRILFLNDLYQKIVGVHGVIVEFGVRWGHNLALLQSLRGIYEPFNHNRKIIGFDTFEGFPSIHTKDGNAEIVEQGAYSVTESYEDYLDKILKCHENESPISHIKKYSLIKGDASLEIDKFLSENPETIVAFAYFDFDLYEPTKKCLEAIRGNITKGTVIGFDELNMHDFPGETLALKEIFGLDRYKIHRSPFSSCQSYIVID